MEPSRFRLWCRIGAAGCLLSFVAALTASPAGASGAEVWSRGVGLLADLDSVRVMIGAAVAPIGATLAAAGCLAVFAALAPGGRVVAGVAALGLAAWFIGYGAHAAGRPLLAQLHRVPELTAESALITEAATYLNVHRALGGVGLFFGSMFFFFAVLFRPTGLPRGAAILAPVLWMPLVRLTPWLPSGAGAFWFAYLDFVGFAFFLGLARAGRGSEQLE